MPQRIRILSPKSGVASATTEQLLPDSMRKILENTNRMTSSVASTVQRAEELRVVAVGSGL